MYNVCLSFVVVVVVVVLVIVNINTKIMHIPYRHTRT
jgi:hypothetical protein